MKKILNNDMKKQLDLSLPTGFECLMGVFIGLIDTAAITPIGNSAVAAVGAMASVIDLFYLLLQSVNVSNNSIVARLFGANKLEDIKKQTGTSVIVAIIFTLICTVITLLISPILPRLFKVDTICLVYLYIRLIGAVPNSVISILNGHQRTLGKSKKVMYVKLFNLILNVILDFLAVKLNFGVAGVAVATVISDVVSMIILVIMSKNTVQYKLSKNHLNELLPLVKYSAEERVFKRCSNLAFNVILSRMGTNEYAVYVILFQIVNAFENFFYGVGVGVTSNIGIAIGKNDTNELKKVENIVEDLNIVMSVITPIFTILLLKFLVPILIIDEVALQIANNCTPFVIVCTLIIPICCVTSASLRGLKDFKYSAKTIFISSCVVKLGVAVILCNTYLGIAGALAALAISNLFTTVLQDERIEKVKSNFLNI